MERSSAQRLIRIKRLLRFFSPCVLCFILSVIGIIGSYAALGSSEGWSLIGVIVLIPAASIFLIADLFFRMLFKRKLLYFWVAELAVVCITIWYLWDRYGFFT